MQYLYQSGTNFPYSYSNADFSISIPAPFGAPSQGNVIVTITLLGNNMWKAAASARQALMANFVDFLQNIETNLELTNVLIPGATYLISQYLADRIPASPTETLFYRYSLSPGTSPNSNPYIDVVPGMQLHIETQSSQYLTPSSPLNGYVSNGGLDLRINSVPASPQRTVAFDPFLATIRSPLITGAPSSVPFVGGGLVDLQPVSAARAHVRLFYPTSMPADSLPGGLGITGNVTLLSAPTLAALNDATTKYPTAVTSGSPPNVYTIILGRAIGVPEIPIWITFSLRGVSALQYVPVGTTITHIIERFTTIPLAINSQSVGVARVMRGALSNAPTYFSYYTTGLSAYSPALFDVPLIDGDGVTLQL